jgi:hypothetical protein
MVTETPTAPEVGVRLVILGAGTVKVTPLLACPATVTTTAPVLAPFGTGATTLVVLQLPGVVMIPLNVTMLPPWADPKFVPLMVTDVPGAPEVGERLLMLGAGTVKPTPLLA